MYKSKALLRELTINNYALINHLEIIFQGGFSVITGETGSGKSIILGALDLVLGKRADLKSLRNKDKKCVIECTFILDQKDANNYKEWFLSQDLDYHDETIIRREILPSGKSRAFINDTPVSLQVLKSLTSNLIDIHSQHENRLLDKKDFIYFIIDSQVNNEVLFKEYQLQYDTYKSKSSELEKLKDQLHQQEQRKDYLQFQLKEFEGIALEDLAENDIEKEYEILSNAEQIKTNLSETIGVLEQNHNNVLEQLTAAQHILSTLSQYGDTYQALLARIQSTEIEIADIASDLNRLNDGVEIDALELTKLNETMSALHQLQKKHHVSNVSELIKVKSEISAELSDIENIDSTLTTLEKEKSELEHQLRKLGTQISKARTKIIPQLEENGKDLLGKMKMPNASFKFDLRESSEINQYGMNEVELLAKTNKGMDYASLGKIASGGETSRIMLAIKALQSRKKSLPTIIFDEIDTGVSGEVATHMGDIMKNLSQNMQVISITHLAQIAAKGDAHFKVFKKDTSTETETHIIALSDKERIEEIAGILSGSKITDAAIENAKALLD